MLSIIKMVSKECMKKYSKYVGIFLLFVVIFSLAPISGDDWGNYLVGKEGIRHSLGVALGMYFDWEGRFISRIFINILTYHKWLWNIVNALLIVAFLIGVVKIVDKKRDYIFPLIVLLILGMNPYMFSQVMVWIAGNITYFFVVPIIIWYFYYLISNDNYNKWFVPIFSLVNLLGVMFVENMALVLVLGNIFVLIFKYIKNKKVDKRIILYLILSVIGTVVMLLSPGTKYRSSIENSEFNALDFLEKIVSNIPNFIYYTFIGNSYLLGLLSLSNYFMIRENVSNKLVKSLLIIYMLVGGLLTMCIYPLTLIGNSSFSALINSNNIFIVGYWLIYLFITLVLIWLDDKNDLRSFLWFLIGLVGNLVMLISPTWGFRTSFFTYVIFGIVAITIIGKYLEDNKGWQFVANGLMLSAMLVYLIFYINISRCQNALENSISTQKEQGNTTIYIEAFSPIAGCNINPENAYHLEKFKLYYGIDQDTHIELVRDRWKYIIFYIG